MAEYYADFLPIIERLQAEKLAQEAARQKKAADKLLTDMVAGGHVVLDARKAAASAYYGVCFTRLCALLIYCAWAACCVVVQAG